MYNSVVQSLCQIVRVHTSIKFIIKQNNIPAVLLNILHFVLTVSSL